MVTNILRGRLEELYETKKRRKWGKIACLLEKRGLWRDSEFVQVSEFMNECNMVYALANTKTKKVYIGRTTLERGKMGDGWSKDKCSRYMDWIECKWINKYRGWALN